jgi:hypothetical protein
LERINEAEAAQMSGVWEVDQGERGRKNDDDFDKVDPK